MLCFGSRDELCLCLVNLNPDSIDILSTFPIIPEKLELHDNSLTGSIPTELGSMTSLGKYYCYALAGIMLAAAFILCFG